MDGRTRLATVAALIGFLAAPAAANAAIRYAEPGGNGPEPCLRSDPCGIHHAAQGHVASDVVNGDEIVLLPGDYSLSDGINLADPNLDFHGQTGQPRPRLVSTSSSALSTSQTGIEISHLEIEQSGSVSGLLTFGSASVAVDGVRVHTFSPTQFTYACGLTGTVTMRNSVCWNSGAFGSALGTNMSGGAANVTLRNVTAVSSAPTNSTGISFSGNLAGTSLAVTATNVIARGVTRDVQATATTGATSTITLDHSNYASVQENGTGVVTDPGTGTNQTAAPVFLDSATGGFHQAAGSPTVDQGANDPSNGLFDIDIEPRTSGGTTDIGADEFVATDTDGDGRPDGADACPNGDTGWTSSAGTDHDSDGCRDAGAEDLDDDNDIRPDTGDNCATGDLGWISTTLTDNDGDGCRDAGAEDADDDNDTVADGSDNCPVTTNPDQANNDTDAQGDICDADDDNDGDADGSDNCQFVANADQANADADGEGDACDADDDNDTVADGVDDCSAGDTGWTSNATTDIDGDGCRDAGEDADDDNDSVDDGSDNCPVDSNPGQANNDGDAQGDACDSDDDNDTVADGADNCPVDTNPSQANNDGDVQGDACDSDDDNDTVADGADNCPTQGGPAGSGGCPEAARDTDAPETTIAKQPRKRTFSRPAKFELSSDDAGARFECSLDGAAFAPCEAKVKLRVGRGKHTFAARAVDSAGNTDTTPASFKWKVKRRR